MKTTARLIFFVFVLCGVFFSSAVQVGASGVLFSDSFDSGSISSSWSRFFLHPPQTQPPWSTNDWHVSSSALTISFNQTFVDGGIIVDGAAWDDYVYDVDFEALNGSDKNIVFRYQDPNNWYGIHANPGGIYVERYLGGSYSDFFASGYSLQNNHVYKLRTTIVGSLLNFKVIDGGTEVVNFDYEFIGNPLHAGGVGFRAATGSDGNLNIRFDNVLVRTPGFLPDPTPTPTPTSTLTPAPTPTPTPTPRLVPLFSQKSEPWGSQMYDQASGWIPAVSNTSFSRWGCAVTSAAMVLQYHGVARGPSGETTDPGTLNSWLRGQSDGYLRNGATNWLALTRYAKRAKLLFPSQTSLEFVRSSGANLPLLDSELEAGRPVILEENELSTGGRHFIVATEKNGSDYAINDSYFASRTLLSAYGNTFLGTRRFIPSNTDLSYLFFVVDPEVELSIADNHGNTSFAGSFYGSEDPLSGEELGQNSGKPVRVLMVPKPEDAAYIVTASSGTNRSYRLESYLYDQNGESKVSTSSGILSLNNPETIVINYSKENSNDSLSFKEITYDTVRKDYEEASAMGLVNKREKAFLKKLLAAKTQHQLGQHGKPETAALIKLAKYMNANARKKEFLEPALGILRNDANQLLQHNF